MMPNGIEPVPPHDMDGPFIELTADDANQVRMLTIPGAAIAPVPLKSGKLILPLSVLSDPAHAGHKQFLESLPQIPKINSAELADGSTYPDEFKACQYDSNWEPGVPHHVNLPAEKK
jgi:hypothetical protein